MQQMNMSQIHARLLDILSDVDRFCRDNDLKYSLAFGTLLGAVRHKGFIPWDDDIDIIMPRPDFDRFTAAFNRCSGSPFRCIYNTRNEDEFFALGFAKVHDPGTSKFIGDRTSLFRYGVSVDIFPLDAVPEDPDAQHELMHRIIHLHHRLYFRHKKFPYGSPLAMLESRLHSMDWWWDRCMEAARSCDYGSSIYIAHILGSNTYESVHRKDLFDTLTDISFEGRNFLAFKDTDAYLTQVFGPDYMTPPPVEQRVGHDCKMYQL